MDTNSRVSSIVHIGAAFLLLFFFGRASATTIDVPAVQRTFDTEILSLNLSGNGQLPLPFPGGTPVPDAPNFSFFDVFLKISPTPGAQHLGKMTVTPGSGALHPIDSFFDIFFDVQFMDSSGRLMIDLPGHSLRITGRNMGAPDAMGHFSPAGHYGGSGMLDDVNLGGNLFDVSFSIDLDFAGTQPPDPTEDGTLYMFNATAEFSGEINPPFGPFQLASPDNDPVRILVRDAPAPGTLALIAIGLLGAAARRRRARP